MTVFMGYHFFHNPNFFLLKLKKLYFERKARPHVSEICEKAEDNNRPT